jgi:uncharacterized membrane protein
LQGTEYIMKQVFQYALILMIVLSGVVGVSGGTVQQTDPDSVVTSFELLESGDAVWTIEYRTQIESAETRASFLSMKDDISEDPSGYLDRFEGRIDRTVSGAKETTNREMSVEDVRINVRLVEFPQEYGVVQYSFVWTNFAIVNGDSLIVSDSLSGFFIEQDGRLVMQWSEDRVATSMSPTPTATTDTSATWEGPVDFDRAGPILELQPAGAVQPTEPEAPTISTPVPPQTPNSDSQPVQPILAFLVGGAITALILLGYHRHIDSSPPSEPSKEPEPLEDEQDTPDSDSEAVDEELLSNEERVVRVLEQNGERMKQQRIVTELGWTDAKTSLVLSDMREAGTVDVFRLGRENVVSLSTEDDSE